MQIEIVFGSGFGFGFYLEGFQSGRVPSGFVVSRLGSEVTSGGMNVCLQSFDMCIEFQRRRSKVCNPIGMEVFAVEIGEMGKSNVDEMFVGLPVVKRLYRLLSPYPNGGAGGWDRDIYRLA